MPDDVLAIAQDREVMHRLGAAFFRVGEARGGMPTKHTGGESWDSLNKARAEFECQDLNATRLEEEGGFHFTFEPDPRAGRVEDLRRLLSE
jgi:hypothetical protein